MMRRRAPSLRDGSTTTTTTNSGRITTAAVVAPTTAGGSIRLLSTLVILFYLLVTINIIVAEMAYDVRYKNVDGAAVTIVQGNNEDLSLDRRTEKCYKGFRSDPRHDAANIFFIGVSKSGTTSLANWMAHHPWLRWTSIKRLQLSSDRERESGVLAPTGGLFHSDMWNLPDGTYGLNPPEEMNPAESVVNYSPHLVSITELPYRLFNAHGNATFDGRLKYILLIREPAARTISSWKSKFRTTKELKKGPGGKSLRVADDWRTLEEVIREGKEAVGDLLRCRAQEQELLSSDVRSRCAVDLARCPPKEYLGYKGNLHLAHIGKSLYALQLERWFFLVGKKNIKIVFFEEMVADTLQTLESLFEFLGLELVDRDGNKGLQALDYWKRVIAFAKNQTPLQPFSVEEQVTPEIVQSLRDFFAPHNIRLEELLGRPLPDSWATVSG